MAEALTFGDLAKWITSSITKLCSDECLERMVVSRIVEMIRNALSNVDLTIEPQRIKNLRCKIEIVNKTADVLPPTAVAVDSLLQPRDVHVDFFNSLFSVNIFNVDESKALKNGCIANSEVNCGVKSTSASNETFKCFSWSLGSRLETFGGP